MEKPTNTQTIYLKDATEVILHNYRLGQGKIIISNPYGNNHSYYWGAMGETIQEFILGINESYFTQNLAGYPDSFDAKKTIMRVRYYLRYECDLNWYENMEL
jgi:hypothetical protein